MARHSIGDSEDGDGETTVFGEPMMPVPRFGRGSGMVPVRWVRSVVLLASGATLVMSQLVMWIGWNREPIFAFLTVGAALMGTPAVMSLDERRQGRS